MEAEYRSSEASKDHKATEAILAAVRKELSDHEKIVSKELNKSRVKNINIEVLIYSFYIMFDIATQFSGGNNDKVINCKITGTSLVWVIMGIMEIMEIEVVVEDVEPREVVILIHIHMI